MRFTYTKAVVLQFAVIAAIILPLLVASYVMVVLWHWPAWACVAMPLALIVLAALVADVRREWRR